jgi:hypothetical protein
MMSGIGARILKQTLCLPGYVFVNVNTNSMTLNMAAATSRSHPQRRQGFKAWVGRIAGA